MWSDRFGGNAEVDQNEPFESGKIRACFAQDDVVGLDILVDKTTPSGLGFVTSVHGLEQSWFEWKPVRCSSLPSTHLPVRRTKTASARARKTCQMKASGMWTSLVNDAC